VSPDLVDSFRVTFPEIFALYLEPDSRNEINCDDGWFLLISDMCLQLMTLDQVPRISLIKEKFGELRIHMENSNSESSLIRALTETQSLQTCEICGDYGARIDSDGVFKTVCAKHRNFREERRKLRGY
jgi:hypothetical protein